MNPYFRGRLSAIPTARLRAVFDFAKAETKRRGKIQFSLTEVETDPTGWRTVYHYDSEGETFSVIDEDCHLSAGGWEVLDEDRGRWDYAEEYEAGAV